METWGQLGRNHMGSAPARGRHDALFYSNSQIPLVYTSSKSAGRYQLRQPARGGPPPWRAARAPASIQSCIRARRTPSTPTGRAWPCLWRRATGQLVLQPRRLTLQTLQKKLAFINQEDQGACALALGRGLCDITRTHLLKVSMRLFDSRFKRRNTQKCRKQIFIRGDSNVPKILFKRKLKCFKIKHAKLKSYLSTCSSTIPAGRSLSQRLTEMCCCAGNPTTLCFCFRWGGSRPGQE